MIYHLLFAIALMAFSVVSTVAATPRDAGEKRVDATSSVSYKEVARYQGGNEDKDVAIADAGLALGRAPATGKESLQVNQWSVARTDSSPWQSVLVLFIITGFIIFFIARKTGSTK